MTKKIIVVYERFQDSKKIVSFLKNKNYDVISLDFNSHIQLTDLKIKHTIFDSKLSESEKESQPSGMPSESVSILSSKPSH